jgi:hypothetical protein
MSAPMGGPPPPGSQGARLFDAMVRWKALATTSLAIGVASGFANLIYTGTGGEGTGNLGKSLALIAVVGIVTAAFSGVAHHRARRRFVAWYVENG